jgi:hypothetical protein
MNRYLSLRPARSIPLFVAAAAVCLASFAAAADSTAKSAALSEARLNESAAYLASEELEGRGVGTAGLDKAADYIAEQFAEIGLRTDLFDGTPFQSFEVTVATELGPQEHNTLVLCDMADNEPAEWTLNLGEDFTPLAAGGTGEFYAPLVFAGYGITAPNLKRGDEPFAYDDYAGIDAKGKVVILLRKEPQQQDPSSPFDGVRNSQHATFMRKISNASEHGAAAVIIVNDSQEVSLRRKEAYEQLTAQHQRVADLLAKLKEATDPAEQQKLAAESAQAAEEVRELAQRLSGPADGLLDFKGAGDESRHRNLPVYFASREAIDKLLKQAIQKDLATLEQEIDSDLVPRSVELKPWHARGRTDLVQKKATVKNVAGVLDGVGPLADETIVIGAHYDHLGYGGAGSLAPWTTAIHHGADDNASGTATLIEVARRLAASPERPRRRIVFIAFTGEERGLLGSAHYVRQPRFPLENTVAMFNLDMVGRLNNEKLIVYGTGTAQEFDALAERLSQEHGFAMTKHPGGFGPSDHSSFYSRKIPVLHLFTGTHTDYHRPSDTAEKLNIAGMRRVADWLVDFTRATDAKDARPTYVEIKRVERIAADAPAEGDRPSFGSMPAYPNPAPDGVLLEAILEGSAAEKGGIRAGDVLQQLGESKIAVLEDFEGALRKHKAGDKVKVVVRRGEEQIETEVTLGRRR